MNLPTEHADSLANITDLTHRRYQNLAGGGIGVGLSKHGMIGSFTHPIPWPRTPIIISLGVPGRVGNQRLSGGIVGAEDHFEFCVEHRRIENALSGLGTVLAIDGLASQINQKQFAIEPVLNLSGHGIAGFRDVGLHLIAQQFTHLSNLQQRQQASGDEQHTGGHKTYLVTDLH
ncbi:hypothetical protein D3C81_1142280 [compost metagenome]